MPALGADGVPLLRERAQDALLEGGQLAAGARYRTGTPFAAADEVLRARHAGRVGSASPARQTEYDWESGRRQIPAAAPIAAA
jgi:hypothetical protein